MRQSSRNKSHTAITSVGQQRRLLPWFQENYEILKLRLDLRRRGFSPCDAIFGRIDALRDIYEQNTGRRFEEARILEIGYGQRALQLIGLSSLGHRVTGVDLDQPMINGTFREMVGVARKGGARRLVKSTVRHFCFDRWERRKLASALKSRGASIAVDTSRFVVGNAADLDISPGSIDLIYSYDVFEHIPSASLDTICEQMSRWLTPHGLAVISPDIYTGIAGGHLPEWYGLFTDHRKERRSEPWEHLRKRRYKPDCYLNEFRLEDYRRTFQRRFEIIEEWNEHAGRGSPYLTPQVRAELSDLSEEELLLGRYRFVMQSRERSPGLN